MHADQTCKPCFMRLQLFIFKCKSSGVAVSKIYVFKKLVAWLMNGGVCMERLIFAQNYAII